VQTLQGDMLDDECPVCLHGMLSGDRVITLCCRHTLHWACIEPWLIRKVSYLPLCLSVCLSVCLCVYLSICLSVCLSIY